MPRYELSDGNVILAGQGFIDAHHPGASELPDPPAPPVTLSWPAIVLYRRMTSAERIAIRTLAATDPIAMDFDQTMNHMIASGQTVYENDADLQAGLTYLQSHPSGSPIFTSVRVAELLSA
jgi:hypothetical protein